MTLVMTTLQFLLRHGCYCGLGNHGNVMPEDGYDDCCQKHDGCYEKSVKECACSCTVGQYLSPYWFECSKCQAKCYLPFPFKYTGWYRRCALGLCECDRKMMECWKRNNGFIKVELHRIRGLAKKPQML